MKCNSIQMSQAWYDLREAFEVDDGSLPDLLAFRYERGEAVSEAFEYLRSISQPISTESMFYSSRLEKEVSLNSVQNPASLVVTGEAESFCLMFYGTLADQNKDLPELGVFVFPEELQFYYRPGPDWSEQSLVKLFQIMSALTKINGFKMIKSLQPDTKYYSDFWSLFEKHYKRSQEAV